MKSVLMHRVCTQLVYRGVSANVFHTLFSSHFSQDNTIKILNFLGFLLYLWEALVHLHTGNHLVSSRYPYRSHCKANLFALPLHL